LNYKQPKNETETHFLLKEISKYILWGWGYNKLGTEVHGMWDLDIGKKRKEIIDCVGLKKISEGRGKYHYDMKGIEAKASLSDFKNGFCCAPAYTYVIAPIGIIPMELVPDRIGCIEIDFNIFELKKYSQRIPDMKGVTLVKKAKRRIDSRFKSEEAYRKWCEKSLERVAYRCGSELLFWRNYIEFK